MKTRNSWGIVYVSVFIGLLIIASAYGAYRFEQTPEGNVIGSGTSANGKDVGVSPGTSSTTISSTMAQDLYSGYLNLTQQGTFTAQQQTQMLSSIVSKDVPPENVVPQLSVSNLNVVPNTPIQNYISLVALILNQSTQIKQDDSYVFSNTVQDQITTGTPTLIQDANVYQRIAAALLVMPVPPSVENEHLELVKSIGGLSNSVRNMGTWSGDPIEALTEVDTYNKVKAYVENSSNALLAAVQKIEAQKS